MVMELLNSTVKILSEGVVQWKKALLKIPGDKPGPCSARLASCPRAPCEAGSDALVLVSVRPV